MSALLCYRNSVCLPVRPSVTRVDQSKTIKVRIMQFSPYNSAILDPSSFCGLSFIQKFWRVPLIGGVKQRWGGIGITRYFLALCVSIFSKMVRDNSKVTINESHGRQSWGDRGTRPPKVCVGDTSCIVPRPQSWVTTPDTSLFPTLDIPFGSKFSAL